MKENTKIIMTKGSEDEYFTVHIYVIEEDKDNGN